MCPAGWDFLPRKGRSMCEQCALIDKKINDYRRMASYVLDDQKMQDGITRLIEQMKAQRDALHPDQKK
jgi:hypothetical protein